jgi:hypothetical protein
MRYPIIFLSALVIEICSTFYIRFERDKELEIQMAERLILATEFYNEVLTQLKDK